MQKQLNDTISWNQLRMNWKQTFAYWHFIWITLMKVNLCSEQRQGNLFLLFFLRQNEANLQNLTIF